MLYPKMYATYLGKFRLPNDDGFVGFVDHGSVYRFVTDDGEVIEACAGRSCKFGRSLGRSGSTPSSVRRRWHLLRGEVGYDGAVHGIMPIGTRVKLFYRGDRLMYRHLGE